MAFWHEPRACRLICIRKRALANGSAASRQLAASRGPVYKRTRAAVPSALAGGGRAARTGFWGSLPVFCSLFTLDNLLFVDRIMTLEEVRGQDTVPESTAR